MEKAFVPSSVEENLYRFWENQGLFTAQVESKKKPFSIILPPPNVNGDLHLGHAMFVFEDIMIRYRKLKGYETLWLPGLDHAGIETQFVFEKQLKKEGKSRFDFDRETLYKMIWDFTMANRKNIEIQLRKLGFALDWTKEKFTLDKDIIKIVYSTFKKLYDAGLIYRAKRLVNYCTHCGTSFSDLEVNYIDRVDPLYFMKYGPFTLATTRPETKFGDTALAVHPDDKRYKKWIGKEVEAEGLLGNFKIKVVADKTVDPKFGTGVIKVTPAHDFTDFEIGQRHHLEMKQVIGFDGRLNELTGPYKGMRVKEARKKIVEDLQKKGLMVKVKSDYSHRVGVCYRCGTTIEPLPLEQWYIKIKPLSAKALALVKNDEIDVHPKRFKKILVQILENYIDWNISRQIVWGIRIPAWKCGDCNEWTVTAGVTPPRCKKCHGSSLKQDPDTFDTWFSSAQWPFATLQTIPTSGVKSFFEYFYPTTVMETGYDILRAWVARMIMIGYFATEKVPFKNIYLHGLIRDKKGQKMSKSKENVINPLEKVQQFGADAWRASLVFGIKDGADVSLSDERIIGMRNFANKIWNIGRFIYLNKELRITNGELIRNTQSEIEKLQNEFKGVKKQYTKHMEAFQFSKALEEVYEFLWHRFADYYIEELKEGLKTGTIEVLKQLETIYTENLKMLHPFIPFVTEAVYKALNGEDKTILNERL